ncbi:tetratricopeptide repeat protein [Caedibacter taeniospiralis]|uniref:tetratricopeptide repeat protein n=1 Tax=Caedibacter taeniospiralis TaxID=28907 RepID=UPI000C271F81|nr:hypothetical protein [Caedibacter taeniospiralis]
MKKAIGLGLVCALAVLGSLWVLSHPGVVAFFVDDTLVKLPLWLFVVLIVVFFLVSGLLYHVLKLVLLSPAQWWQGLHKRKCQKLIQQLINRQKSYFIRDYIGLEKHRAQAQVSLPVIGDGLTVLYWQSLLVQGKCQELQSILQSVKEDVKDRFIWRYYQAMIFYKAGAFSAALSLLQTLVKEEPNSLEIVDALINSQIRQKECIGAKNSIVKYQRILSQASLDDYFYALLQQVVSLRDLNEIWLGLPRSYAVSARVEYCYFKRLSGLISQDELRERMQKRLVSSLQYELSLLYLELGKDEVTDEFIKSCWLKEKTHEDQALNLLVMTHALLHNDLSFIESNLHVVHHNELKKIDQAKLMLLKSKLAEYQSRAHEGQKLQHEFEKLLLESQ